MNRKSFCTLVAGAPALGACVTGAAVAAGAAPTVRVAIVPIDADAQFYYADDLGLFRKRHLDVQLQSIVKGSAILAAVIGGSVDVGVANPISVITAYKRGVDLTCIAPSSYYSSKAPSTVLVVNSDSPIKTARDLEGKAVGVNALKDLTQLATMAWIDKNGGDSSKVKFLELGFSGMIPALSQSRVDAAVVAEPLISTAKKTGRVIGNPYDAVSPHFPVGCFFVMSAFAKQNPTPLQQMVDTLREAGTWANGHQRESADILARATKTDAAIIQGNTRVVYSEQRLTPGDLQPVVNLCAKYHVIAESFPASEIVWSEKRQS